MVDGRATRKMWCFEEDEIVKIHLHYKSYKEIAAMLAGRTAQ